MSAPEIFGRDLFGEVVKQAPANVLSGRFIVPPFSVLSARDGPWQERKQAWQALGIRSELGRGDSAGGKLTMSDTVQRLKPSADQALKNGRGFARTFGQDLMRGEHVVGEGGGHAGSLHRGETGREAGEEYEGGDAWQGSGTSIFDPVLCECAYTWFSPVGGQVVDPFAGGSVRGITAAMLGRRYWGCDLRGEQVAANVVQAQRIVPAALPTWVEGDAIAQLPHAPAADFLFSCPPYGDLEVYSDDPRDLSTMSFTAFIEAYRAIIAAACQRLLPNRFACFVVGEYRGAGGAYVNFVGETVAAFLAAGLKLYNEAILVTSVGSLPIRVTRQFEAGRKLGKTHQNVLVFVKGDGMKAAARCREAAPSPAPVEAESAAPFMYEDREGEDPMWNGSEDAP